MWRFSRELSLGRRIVENAALGLALVTLFFGLLAFLAIRGTVEATYRERVALAQVIAQHVDDALGAAWALLESEAGALQVEPGGDLTPEQRTRLAGLRSRVDGLTLVAVARAGGAVAWSDPDSPGVLPDDSILRSLTERGSGPGGLRVAAAGPVGGAAARSLWLSLPLRDSSGRAAGFLLAGLDPGDKALDLLPSSELGHWASVQLTDPSGQWVAGAAPADAGVGAAHRALLAPLMASRTPGYRVHLSRGGFGGHLVVYAPVATLPGWGIVLEQPGDVVLTLPRELVERLGLFGLVALLVAGVMAALSIRRIVWPLGHLTAAAGRFAAGALDEPLQLDQSGELGPLAEAFETMRQRLRSARAEVAAWNQELERRVFARTAEVEAQSRELAHLNALAETVSESLDVEVMLNRTLERVAQITGAEVGCFVVAEPDGSRLALVAGLGRPARAPGERPCSGCLGVRAIATGEVLTAEATPDAGTPTCGLRGLESALALPLLANGQVQGGLVLGSRRPGHFPGLGLATLLAIGRQVGMALANARLYQSLRARERERAELLQRVIVAQEEERRRLAQELHDETSQNLAALQLGLERLAADGDLPQPPRELAGQLQAIAVETLKAIHRLAVELRPSVLDDVGLIAALERYLRECARRTRLAVEFAPVGVDGLRLPPTAETAVYRVVQAAVANVVRHAGATRVTVLLERRAEELIVVVEDDGRGFDLEATRGAALERRLGLAGMEERAALIGGALTVETAPGAGTAVFLAVPLDADGWGEKADAEATSHPG